MSSSRFPSYRTLVTLFILCIVCACGAFLKLYFFGETLNSDYPTYVATAQQITGETVTRDFPFRLLKPLNPLLIAGMHTVMSYETAFIFQALIFYFAFIVVMYLLAYEFFEDRFLAASAVLITALSYPMLKYGIDVLTETGAIFFYTCSLWLTLRFLKKINNKVFLANVLIVILGVMWKEYSIVAAVIFGLAVIFHAGLSYSSKFNYTLLYVGLFLLANIPLQVFIYFKYHYTYLSWYREGGAPGLNACGFDTHDITKSTGALLGVAWLAVPFGFRKFFTLPDEQRRFLSIALPVPFMAYLWGCISSRLLYVIAPPFALLALWGIRGWNRNAQVAFVTLTVLANITWLFLSYSVTV